MLKYFLYISILFISSIAIANSNSYVNNQPKQAIEEISTDCINSNLFNEEFADQTDDDNDKHSVFLKRKIQIYIFSNKNTQREYLKSFTESFLLLNAYLDLPPPSIM